MTGMTTRTQISAAIDDIVCEEFDPIYYSGSKDTLDTVKQIKRYNTTRNSFGCKDLEHGSP
jgi:hypothetical protein